MPSRFSRRPFVLLTCALLTLTVSCSGSSDSIDSGSGPTTDADESSTPTGESESSDSGDSEAPDSDSESTQDSSEEAEVAETVVVTHALGEDEIPASPQRIVATDDGTLALLLELGITPVAAGTLGTDAYGDSNYHPSLTNTSLTDVVTYSRNEPNYEIISSLQPDLIVGSSFALQSRVSDGGTTYESIAPLVAYDSNASLLEQVIELGHLVGASEQAEELTHSFLSILNSLHDQVEGTRVSIARPFGDSDVFIYTRNEPVTAVWVDLLGLEVTPGPNVADERGYVISSGELITQLDGDYLLVIGGEDRLSENPLWDSLSAVQADQVYDLGDYLTYSGYGGLTELASRLEAFGEFLAEP